MEAYEVATTTIIIINNNYYYYSYYFYIVLEYNLTYKHQNIWLLAHF